MRRTLAELEQYAQKLREANSIVSVREYSEVIDRCRQLDGELQDALATIYAAGVQTGRSQVQIRIATEALERIERCRSLDSSRRYATDALRDMTKAGSRSR